MATNTAPRFTLGGTALDDLTGAYDFGRSLAVLADGRFLVGGGFTDGGQDATLLARFNADGTRDFTFGNSGGFTRVDLGYSDFSEGIALQSDGSILIAGLTEATLGSGYDFLLQRFDANGNLDPTFGVGGSVITDFGGYDVSRAIAIQPDGKIIIGGNSDAGSSYSGFTMARYNPDGSLDSTFDFDGKVIAQLTDYPDTIYGIELLPDGRFLASGFATEDTGLLTSHFALARFNADGSLDSTFGTGGAVTTPISPSGDGGQAMVVQSDGRIIVAGYYQPTIVDYAFAAVRYNADGSLDTSFDGDGIFQLVVGTGRSLANGVALQSDGKILLAGRSDTQFAIVRLNTDGSLDTTFSGDGVVTTDFLSYATAQRVAVLPDGRILVIGEGAGTGFGFDIALARYNSDGSLDSTFGTQFNTLDGNTAYTAGGAPAVLDSDVKVYDAELAAQGHYGGASVTLARQGGANAADAFFATGSLGALTEGATLFYEGVGVGTVTTNSAGTLVLTFNANATQARVDGVLQSIAYGSPGSPPSGFVWIDWFFSDGNLGAQGDGGALAATGTSLVQIINSMVLWSDLVDGQFVSFDPNLYVLRFDDPSISAADVVIGHDVSGLVQFSHGGKTVTVTLYLGHITTSNVVFEDGSVLAVGNNSVDDFGDLDPNTVTGGARDDQLYGLDGDDTLTGGHGHDLLFGGPGADSLSGGRGNDLLDGGAGFDAMSGGEGDDIYIVDHRAPVDPSTLLSLFGEPGAYVFEGSLVMTTIPGAVFRDLRDFDNDGLVDTVTVGFSDGTNFFDLSLSTRNIPGSNLAPGFYADAQRFFLEEPGHAGLTLSGNHRGDNQVFGNFTIREAVFDYSPGFATLVSFSADFEYHGEFPGAPGIFGTFNYDYATQFVPESVIELANQGTDTVRSSIDYVLPENVENLVLTGNALRGTGNVLVNVITGNSLDNVIDGAQGADSMAGREGNDTYFVDNSGDTVTESAGEGIDTVESRIAYTLGANLENLTLIGTAAIGGTGNGLDNVITGNSAANVLRGRGGNDTYVIDASDTVVETAGQGTDLVQASFSYTLGAHLENLTLLGTADLNGTGNALANVLTGNSGANTLDGRGGNDTMAGAGGNDTYIVDAAGDSVVESSMGGTDLVRSSVSHTLGANVENLTLTGTAAINGAGNALDNVLTGNSANNRLTGGAGNDSLDGRAGADIMAGGLGDDTFVVDDRGDRVTELLNQGNDTVRSAITYTLGANLENLVLTGTAAIDGTGNALDNVLTGNAARNRLTGGDGNDQLDGRGGADRMIGGRGNDRYVVDQSGDVVTEQRNQGTDTVFSAITYVLGDHVENLTLTGTASIDGTGNDLGNVIIGNTGRNRLTGGRGNDTLNGLAGADTMTGGKGDDAYHVDHAGDVVTERRHEGTDTVTSSRTYTLGAHLENLTLVGVGAIDGIGNELDNVITGNLNSNTLRGLTGDDVLDGGGAGFDVLIGGRGDDVYIVRQSSYVVREAAGEGRDHVRSSASFVLSANVEDLTLTGTFAIEGTGNALANTLTGNSAANRLDGGAGADRMRGGAGDDRYIVDHARDEVTERSNEGTDTVLSSLNYALGNHVENLVLTGHAALNGTGNSLDNALTGNSAANTLRGERGNDTLDGGGGADRMLGGRGNDTYFVDVAGDRVVEESGEGTDLVYSSITYTLTANVENLTLTGAAALDGTGNTLDNVLIGNAAANTLNGGAGNDFIDGGLGMDTMRGGRGNDTYVVDDADYSNAPTVLVLNGEEGNGIVFGPVLLTPENTQFLVGASDYSFDGVIDTVSVQYSENLPFGGHFGFIDFSTRLLGSGMQPGVYSDAERFPFESFGHPGLWLGHDGTGYGDPRGNFTVREAVFDSSGGTAVTLAFSVEFELRAGPDPALPAIFGRFNYNYSGGVIVPETVVELANEGTDTVRSSVDYVLGANLENLVLIGNRASRGTGNALANAITGNALDNVLDGRAGTDRMAGGAGNDTYIADNTGDVVTENAGQGTDTVLSSATYTLSGNVENLSLTGSSAVNGTGNSLANILIGNAAANVLAGRGGDDTYHVGAGDGVVESAGEGTDVVHSSASFALGANVENLVLVGGGAINGIGNALPNIITGNSGNNTLDGRAGIDTMTGAAGDDTYVVDRTTDVVVEQVNEGTDLVRASATYVLPDHVENLTLTGTAAINATGNALANVLTGNAGNNILDGRGGIDTMIGGAGNDTYVVDQADVSNGPTVLNLFGEPGAGIVEGRKVFGPDDGIFRPTAQDFTGDGLADMLNLYFEDNAGIFSNYFSLDVATRALGTNLEPGVYLDAERFPFENPGHPGLTLVGNFVGHGQNFGHFTINEAVFDYTSGSPVVERFSVEFEQRGEFPTAPAVFGRFNYNYSLGVDVPEPVIELPDQGTDTVRSSIDYTLPDNVENLVLTGSDAIDGVGNTLHNRISGNDAANRLTGGAGRDTFDYNAIGAAADAVSDFTLGASGDRLDIGDVIDYVAGSSNIADFVRLAANGPHTDVSVNSDGVGGDFVPLVTLENIAATPGLLNDMLAQGNLIVV